MASPAYGSLDFAEQIQFFRQKIDLPTRHWTDLWQEAHDRAFVVAKAMQADLLADLHTAVLKGIAEGTTLETFRQDFKEIVARTGWTGWTGEGTAAGRAWRTRVIYETNLRTSYAAGRWAQIQEVKPSRPYLLYRHNDNVLHPRPLHQSWNGKILAADDPWWQTHYPPKGYGCQCTAFAVDENYLRRQGKTGPDQAPDDGTYDWQNPKTGEWVRDIPKGVDPGWAYAPGASLSLDEFVAGKVAKLPGGLGRALSADVATNVRPPIEAAAQAARDDCLAWGRVNNRERFILLDAKSGKELGRFDSGKTGGAVPEWMAKLMNDKDNNIDVVHNHPNESSLSFEDTQIIKMSGVKSVEAVTATGTLFRASAGASIEAVKLDVFAFRVAEKAIVDYFEDTVKMGMAFTKDAANILWSHARNEALSKAGVFSYTAKPSGAVLTALSLHQKTFDRAVTIASRSVVNFVNTMMRPKK